MSSVLVVVIVFIINNPPMRRQKKEQFKNLQVNPLKGWLAMTLYVLFTCNNISWTLTQMDTHFQSFSLSLPHFRTFSLSWSLPLILTVSFSILKSLPLSQFLTLPTPYQSLTPSSYPLSLMISSSILESFSSQSLSHSHSVFFITELTTLLSF